MNIVDQKYLKEDIKDIQKSNCEELYLIFKYCIFNLFNSLLNLNECIRVPKACIKILFDFILIFKEERKLLNFIIENSKYMNVDDVYNFLDDLNDLNDQTVKYFYEYIDNIEDVLETKQNWRLYPPGKEFLFLTESKDFQRKTCNMLLSIDIIKEFLGYEVEFWDYMETRTTYIKDKNFNVEWNYDEKGKIVNMKLFTPYLTDLNSVLVNIKGYTKAHILYKSIMNKKTHDDNDVLGKIKKYYNKQVKYLLD